MGKRKRTRQRAVKVFPASYNSTLIHGHRGVDQRFPQGLKVGGTFIIFPASLKSRRISAHSALEPIPATQTHGKRGLTIARSDLPIMEARRSRQEEHEKAKYHRPPTFKAFSMWQTDRRQGIEEWHALEVVRRAGYEVYLFFSGNKWIIFREEKNIQSRSILYNTQEQCRDRLKYKTVVWDEHYSLPCSPNSS